MNTEESARVKTCGQQGGRDGPGNERGLKLAGARRLDDRFQNPNHTGPLENAAVLRTALSRRVGLAVRPVAE
jgi:hypothetical protein